MLISYIVNNVAPPPRAERSASGMCSQVATDNASCSSEANTPRPDRRQQGSAQCMPHRALEDLTAPSQSAGLGQAETKQQSSSQQGARVREDHAVVASAVVPERSVPVSLPQAVAELFPEHFPTATSAKRACRRGEILVDGTVSKLKYQRYHPLTVYWVASKLAACTPCHS